MSEVSENDSTLITLTADIVAAHVPNNSVAVADLPEEIRSQAMGLNTLYALHDASGERLALVKDRWMAFALARENDMAAVNVH